MKPVEVPWNPALTTGRDGKRYAISGCVWVEVPPETTFDELPLYMVLKEREDNTGEGNKSWQVVGSRGSTYTVRFSQGQWSCTCAGFGWRRTCKHIESKQVS